MTSGLDRIHTVVDLCDDCKNRTGNSDTGRSFCHDLFLVQADPVFL